MNKLAIGILVYIVSLIIHFAWGSNQSAFWISLFYMLQNIGLALICLCGFKQKLAYRIVLVSAFTYFASAFVFYAYALIANKLIYFSNCGEAGKILFWLIGASILLTLIDAWRDGK